jgi:hypothetical protein
MTVVDLRDAWADLLRRRPALAGTLSVYERVLEQWSTAPAVTLPLGWTAEECRTRWSRGVPLIAEASPTLDVAATEESLSQVLELVAGVRPDTAPGLQRFAEAWDRRDLTPASLFPARGRIGTLDDALALEADVVAFLAVGSLRPALDHYFSACREHLSDHDWVLGVCPFCGAPPGFSDVADDGRRRLACHLCGAAWIFTRLRCPFCGNEDTKDLGRLDFEAPADQGYFISTCTQCRAYLKEVDRRVRWNAGPALVEDWGSPHFDLAAAGAGYWRPAAPVILHRPLS